jgi:hypothetical protein
VVESGNATAINFELHALDPAPSTKAILQAAETLGWEIHEDDGDDDDDDDEAEEDDDE